MGEKSTQIEPPQAPIQQTPILRDGVVKKSIMDISLLIAICLCICGVIAYFAGVISLGSYIHEINVEDDLEENGEEYNINLVRGILDLVIAGLFFFLSYPLGVYLYKKKEWWQKIEVT